MVFRFIPFFILVTLSTLLNGQSISSIDSLNHVLLSTKDDSIKAYALDELSYEWFYDDLDSSLIYGQRAYTLFSIIGNKKGQAQSAVSIAVAYHYKNNWDSAAYYYKQSLRIRTQLNDSLGKAKSLNNLGVFYMDKGELEEATTFFLRSLEIRKAINDIKGTAMNYNNLGLVFRRQGNYKKAIEYYSKAMGYFEAQPINNHLGTIYLNLGALYNYQKNFKQGLYYNLKALQIAEQLKSERSLGEASVNASDAYLGLAMPDSSLYYTEKAIVLFASISDTVNLANALNSSAELYIAKKNYVRSLQYSNRLKRLIKHIHNNELQVKNLLSFSEAYAGIGNMNDAYNTLKQSYLLKDSLVNESLNESINKLTIQFETEQKERKITKLELDQKTSDLALASSRNQRNVLILMATMIFLVSFFLYLLLRSKSKNNAIITQALQEKEILLREIHHRVKNNLQVISSLLSLQAGSLDDDKAIEAVKEGQTRVRSMALIHEKLYSGTDLRGVNIQTYIEDLSNELFNVFGVDQEKITYKVETNGLTLDIDTVIPLGLILNELITNVLKYAFSNNTQEGKLRIDIVEKEDKLYVTVQDNGTGMDQDSIEASNSFGWKMIGSLSRKLKADIQITNKNGTLVKLVISRYNLI